MRDQDNPAPVLVFTWGNPSRGDDAIGPQIYDLLINEALEDVDVLTDFQLQIEHVVDLEKRERVIFVDASVSGKAAFEFHQIQADKDDSYTTHAMSPQSLLAVYEQVNKQAAPTSFMLSVRGYEFGLGLAMSDEAIDNLNEAVAFIKQRLSDRNSKDREEQKKTEII